MVRAELDPVVDVDVGVDDRSRLLGDDLSRRLATPEKHTILSCRKGPEELLGRGHGEPDLLPSVAASWDLRDKHPVRGLRGRKLIDDGLFSSRRELRADGFPV